jgi:cytochrome c-type biogenesis protein CcmF
MPVALGLVFLMGIGPYIPWRKASVENIKNALIYPVIFAFGAIGFFFVGGVRDAYALAGLWVVAFVAAAIGIDFAKIATFWGNHDGVNRWRGFWIAYRKNPRRMAGILTHIGVLVMVSGIIFSTIYQTEVMVMMKPGESIQLKSYTFKLVQLYPAQGPNWTAQEGLFNVYKDDRLITQLYPQKRLYTVSQTPTTETAIHQVNMGHLFVTLPEVAPDGSWARVRALHNPLVLWVWYGGGIMGLGVLLNIFRKTRQTTTPATDPALALPTPTPDAHS